MSKKIFPKNLIGLIFNNLKVINNIGRDKWGQQLLECLCSCGNKTNISRSNLISGHIKSCGCKKKEIISLLKKKNKYTSTFNILFKVYKKRAKEKNICFELTELQFKELTKQNCFYCGKNPNQIIKNSYNELYGNYIYNGIDRVNNSIGYKIDNVVPCCGICNKMKKEYSKEFFINHIKKIFDHLKLIPKED